ncbi:hypothetical protein EE612_060308, partial [Oryza sativa]
GSKHGVDRERETDLGGDAVDVGEAHADEAAEALDLRRHVRRRHPRLHHLPARLSPPPPPRERECRPLQSKGELRGFFPPLCAAAAAWSPSRWCSWARSGGPSPFNPNVKGKKYTQGPSTCYRRYKIVPPIRPSTDKTVRFRSLDGFDPGFVRHGGRVSVRPTWPPHVRLAHHLPPSVPLSLFSSLTRCRAVGGREEDPRRDGEVGGGGGGDENGRGREGSESRAAGETASAAKEATRETKEGYDEEAYSCGGGRRRTSSRTRRGKVGEEGAVAPTPATTQHAQPMRTTTTSSCASSPWPRPTSTPATSAPCTSTPTVPPASTRTPRAARSSSPPSPSSSLTTPPTVPPSSSPTPTPRARPSPPPP